MSNSSEHLLTKLIIGENHSNYKIDEDDEGIEDVEAFEEVNLENMPYCNGTNGIIKNFNQNVLTVWKILFCMRFTYVAINVYVRVLLRV